MVEKMKKLSSESVMDSQQLEMFAPGKGYDGGCVPAAIIYPKSADEVQQVVSWARETGTPLVPVSSAAPHMRGTTVPSVPNAAIVDLSGMKKIVSVNRQQRMTVVEPGVTYEELIPVLAENGLELPISLAPKAGKSVLADVVELAPRINPVRQWNFVEPLRCMDVTWGNAHHMFTGGAAGGPMDLMKQQNAESWQDFGPGPMMIDYYRLMTGSQGTLGISSWVSLRCNVLPKYRELLFAAADQPGKLIDLMYEILRLRFGEELLLVNRVCLEQLTGKELSGVPAWIALIGVAGRDICAEMRIKGQKADIKAMAERYGLKLLEELGCLTGDEVFKTVSMPCPPDRYWKTAEKDSCVDIFFTTTLDRTPAFVAKMKELVQENGFENRFAVYIQPQHQGTSVQCEFVLPVALEEQEKAAAFYEQAVREFAAMGAYYARPYGALQAQLQIGADSVTLANSLGVKKIFDPDGIMNPGKLCDYERSVK